MLLVPLFPRGEDDDDETTVNLAKVALVRVPGPRRPRFAATRAYGHRISGKGLAGLCLILKLNRITSATQSHTSATEAAKWTRVKSTPILKHPGGGFTRCLKINCNPIFLRFNPEMAPFTGVFSCSYVRVIFPLCHCWPVIGTINLKDENISVL